MIAVYIIVAIIIVILVIAAFVGTDWHFEKSIYINSNLDKAWQHIRNLHALNQWNPWLDQDENITQKYTGTDGMPGASYSWDSELKNVGAGNQTLVHITEGAEVISRIHFIRPIKGVGDGFVRIAAEGGGTRATWGIRSSTPYPMNIIKLFGVIEKNLDRDFGKGLNKLKVLCEH